MHLRLNDGKAARVDAIETQHRQGAGEAARRPADDAGEYLREAEPFGKQVMGAVAPVIEVAGDDQRSVRRNQRLES